jgi:hypothetical protein
VSTNNLLRVIAVVYVLAILTELALTRRVRRFIWEFSILLVLIVLDVLIANAVTGRVSFGEETSSWGIVLVMLGCVILGIAARYVFYLKGAFSWLEFVKPLCISPIVLLPLIGSIQTVKTLEPMQVLSFGLLAFQNGFFWQVVLERATPVTRDSVQADGVPRPGHSR